MIKEANIEEWKGNNGGHQSALFYWTETEGRTEIFKCNSTAKHLTPVQSDDLLFTLHWLQFLFINIRCEGRRDELSNWSWNTDTVQSKGNVCDCVSESMCAWEGIMRALLSFFGGTGSDDVIVYNPKAFSHTHCLRLCASHTFMNLPLGLREFQSITVV